jgi:hypothetical protein
VWRPRGGCGTLVPDIEVMVGVRMGGTFRFSRNGMMIGSGSTRHDTSDGNACRILLLLENASVASSSKT